MRVEADFEAWAGLGGPRIRNTPPQIVIELLRDQPFFEQRLVPSHLLPQRRLTKESDFQSRHIVRVLTTKRVEGVGKLLPTLLDDFPSELSEALSKDRT